MKKTNFKRKLSVVLSLVLIAVTALIMAGCTDNQTTDPTTTQGPAETTQNASPVVVGEGDVSIDFSVTHKNGTVNKFTVKTSAETATVGEALQDALLIAGDPGDYGLYVKTVDGETLDYDTDGMYWAFYENGNYAATGVDQTEIVAGTQYEFRAEK